MNNNKKRKISKNKIIFIGVLFSLLNTFTIVHSKDPTKSWLDLPKSIDYKASGQDLSFELDVRSIVDPISTNSVLTGFDEEFSWWPVYNDDYIEIVITELSSNDNQLERATVRIVSERHKVPVNTVTSNSPVAGSSGKKMRITIPARLYPVSTKVWTEVEIEDKYGKKSTRTFKTATLVPMQQIMNKWPIHFHTWRFGSAQSGGKPHRGNTCGLHLYNHGHKWPSTLHAYDELTAYLQKKHIDPGYLDATNQGNTVPPETFGEIFYLRDKSDRKATISGWTFCWDNHWATLIYTVYARLFRRDYSIKSEGFIDQEIELVEVGFIYEGRYNGDRVYFNTKDGFTNRDYNRKDGYEH